MEKKQSLDTICIQGGWQPKNGEPRQLPIYQSTTFKYTTVPFTALAHASAETTILPFL